MLKLDYDLAPVLPEDPDDDVRDEGHDDDEETEQPDWQRREDDGVDSDTNTTHIISVRETENICCRPSRYQMSVRSLDPTCLRPPYIILASCFQMSLMVAHVIHSKESEVECSKMMKFKATLHS